MELFSDVFFISEILKKNSSKISFHIIYSDILYVVYAPFYRWIGRGYFIGYGRIDKYKKFIYLETVIPSFLESDIFLFQSFLLDAKLPGLTAKKVEELYEAYGKDMRDYFYKEDWDSINLVLQCDSEKLSVMKQKWQEMCVYIDLHSKLRKCCLSATSIKKIYKTYKYESLRVIEDNPYIMIYSIGFGWKTVDKIASELGMSLSDQKRIEGAIYFVFLEKKRLGHVAALIDELVQSAILLLGEETIFKDIVWDSIMSLIAQKKIIQIENFVALKENYEMELLIFEFFKDCNNRENRELNISFKNKMITDEQKNAVIGAIGYQNVIITGSAGTGKSTIINEIYIYQKAYNKKIVVLTPTGRASQRVIEIYPHIIAMTIHKFLLMNKIYINQKKHFESEIKFDFDHIIIDESSMVDSFLLSILLRHTKESSKITLIGDANQLPPVGVGAPFHVMIDEKMVPVFHLTTVFRQKKESQILEIANKIGNGICPRIKPSSEISFVECLKEDMCQLISDLVDQYYDQEKKTLSFIGITFLNRGKVGTIALNNYIQNYIQKKYYSAQNKKIGGRFYLYDTVVVTKNNYQLDLRNGQSGQIVNVVDSEITVLFGQSKKILIPFRDLDILDLGFVINVYRSQGSEFNFIIIFLFMEQYILLNKKALYTAITRTRSSCILIGEKKAFYCAIKNKNSDKRITVLEKL